MPADTSETGCLSRGHPGLTLPRRHYRNIPKSAPALRRRGHDWLGRYAGYAEAVLFFDDFARDNRQVGGDQDGAPLAVLAEDLEEQLRPGGGQGDEAQLVDDHQAEAGRLPLQVEQTSLVPVFQRSALPRFHRHDAPARFPSRCTSPPWRCWTTGPAAWSRSPEGRPGPAGGPGWKQPCLRPRLEIPTICSSGGGWKTRFISTRQDGILLPFQPGGSGMTLYGYARVSVREPLLMTDGH